MTITQDTFVAPVTVVEASDLNPRWHCYATDPGDIPAAFEYLDPATIPEAKKGDAIMFQDTVSWGGANRLSGSVWFAIEDTAGGDVAHWSAFVRSAVATDPRLNGLKVTHKIAEWTGLHLVNSTNRTLKTNEDFTGSKTLVLHFRSNTTSIDRYHFSHQYSLDELARIPHTSGIPRGGLALRYGEGHCVFSLTSADLTNMRLTTRHVAGEEVVLIGIEGHGEIQL